MNFPDLDIKTIITLLIIGNFAQLVILIIYRNISKYQRPYWHFTAGKILQTIAWLLLSMRGAIPDLLSAYIGNTLLLYGLALETFSLTTVGRSEKSWRIVYLSIATAASVMFWIFASTPNLWVGYSSITAAALFLVASVSISFVPVSSLIRRIVGIFYGIAGLTLAVRAWTAFFSGSEFVLLSRNMTQMLTFTTTFIVLIVGGTGFLLMFKEQADKLINESEEKFRLAFSNANTGMCLVDLKGNLLQVNDKMTGIFGYSRSELERMTVNDLAVSEDTDLSPQFISQAIEENEGRATFEKRYRHQQGHIVHGLVSSSLVRNNKGQPLYFISQVQDFTDRKQAEADKEKLEAQNRQLQKSESLARMAASIAHHFNNQLGVVIGNLEMAIDEQPKGVTTSRSLASAMEAAWRSADMSGLMLTYLGQTHDKREPLDISYACRKILPLIETTMPGNVVMETDFPLPRPIIIANAGEIQQILNNLISNAWEAVGKNNGIISLSVKTVSPIDISTQNRFPVDWESLGKTFACVEVTDTGCGIEDKNIERLFDPFYSNKFTGRGMGLAVVMGLVNSHKGVITVDSKLGRGSTFRLFFPVSEEALPKHQTADTDRDVTISKHSPGKMEEGGTVLVVEDEAMLRDMAAAMLESFGFTVLKAKDGIEALEVFGKHQSEIKFVLTDLTMPRMNGWDTLTELRKLQPGIPVILASGYDLAHVMEGDHPELPQAFLAKPYNLKALRGAISKTLESGKK